MTVSPADWQALWVSVKLALISTTLLLMLCTPLAWWLARRRRRGQALLEALLALPLVLPPTVLGFYLLLWLGPNGPGGLVAGLWGAHSLAFTFTGLVLGSVLYSLPFVLQPLKNAFLAIDQDTLDMAATLGAPPWDRFRNVVLPLARPGYLSAAVLGFAHTLGEFGVVLMIGGNIPDQTRVVSIQIFNHVEAQEYAQAHWLAGGMLLFSFLILLALHWRGRLQPARY